MLAATVAKINHGGVVPASDAERLETLLTKVVRLLAMHGEGPLGDLAGTALSMAEGVLLVELLATGEVTQQQVADRLSLDKSRVSRLCTALERKHLLARQRDESNRRNLRVRITASGAAAATRLRETWHERHELMLAAMTPDERRALLLGLGALARELAAFHPESETTGNRSPRHDPAPAAEIGR
jgi:DNA-binding MarR family transcriptional regulator